MIQQTLKKKEKEVFRDLFLAFLDHLKAIDTQKNEIFLSLLYRAGTFWPGPEFENPGCK
jgi:hypothetical protein